MTKSHSLKILPGYFEDVLSGKKRFEVRKNDRNFEAGDIVNLREWIGDCYSGAFETFTITYVLNIGWCAPGYVVFGIEPLDDIWTDDIYRDE